MSSQQTRSIFVDDSSIYIQYSDGWALQVLESSKEPQTFTPIYDTLHVLPEISGSPISSTQNFSFTFRGSFVAAVFGPGAGAGAIKACTIDGEQHTVLEDASSGQVQCQSNSSLADGMHKLQVEVPVGLPVTFDGVYYSLSASDGNGIGDVVYEASDADIKTSTGGASPLRPGGTLDFDFDGHSLSIYADSLLNDPTMPSTLSYTIDEDPPQNFTITNSADGVYTAVTKRILQTPAYPAGKHHLHMVFYGTNDTVPFRLNQIIVQSTPSNVPLQPFPASVASSSSSAIPNVFPTQIQTQRGSTPSHQSHVGMYIGITVSSVVVFVLVAGSIFRWSRLRRKTAPLYEGSDVSAGRTVEPFRVPNLNRPRSLLVGKSASNARVRESMRVESLMRGSESNMIAAQHDVPPDYVSSS